MRALIIDDAALERIAKVKEYAYLHPFSMDDLLDIVDRRAQSAGDREGFSVEISRGYKVVFSIEDQVKGRVKHLSISVDTPGKLPAIPAASDIAKLFGIEDIMRCHVYLEDTGGGHHAVNIIAPGLNCSGFPNS